MGLVDHSDRRILLAEIDRLTAECEATRKQTHRARDALLKVVDELTAERDTLRAQLDKVRAAIAPQCLECMIGEHEALTAHEVYRR
jgi:hypothetical protein